MSDPREELIEAKAEIVLLRTQLGEAENALLRERMIWCDKPEDRLYHAEDRTWWRRGTDGHAHRADPPPIVLRLARALLRFTLEAVNDDDTYETARRLAEDHGE
jgi:hypothetical protein